LIISIFCYKSQFYFLSGDFEWVGYIQQARKKAINLITFLCYP